MNDELGNRIVVVYSALSRFAAASSDEFDHRRMIAIVV